MTAVTPGCPLALTCGDPAGVGPEVIEAWLRTRPDAARFALLGPASWLDRVASESVQRVPVGDAAVSPGKPTVEGARAAVEALEAAAAGVQDGRFCGAVTGPISKLWAQRAGFAFPGQTEFFEARWGGEAVMTFAGGALRVALVTWHIPLMRVAAELTSTRVARAIAAAAELGRADGLAEPRIAVCGLNPHAGESGLLGSEERDWLDACVASHVVAHPRLHPTTVPGDTAFVRALRGEFDCVVALYHDQGLAPLKAVDFDRAVNVTLGLPWVRTSPDHGTAFDIAGTGRADPSSWANAVALAERLINARARR